MITIKILLLFYYTLRISFFFLRNTLFSFWILIELNLLLFLLVMFILEMKNQDFFHTGLYYFIFQSFGSVLFLLSMVIEKSIFQFYMEWVLILSLVIKIGLYPRSFWVFQIGSHIKIQTLYFLLVIQKIPLFFILFYCSSPFYICLTSFIFGSVILSYRAELRDLFVSSSLSSILLFYLIFSQSLKMFVLFVFLYSLILYIVFFNFDLNYFVSRNTNLPIFSVIILSFLRGLPPMRLFFFKFDIVEFLSFSFNSIELLLFWTLRFIGLFGYFKFFFNKFFFFDFLYLNNDFSFLKISSILCFFSLFFFFFI